MDKWDAIPGVHFVHWVRLRTYTFTHLPWKTVLKKMDAKYSKMPATWCCKLSRKYFIPHLWKHVCCAERSLRVQKGNHKGSSFGGCSHRGREAWVHTSAPRWLVLSHFRQPLKKSRNPLWNKAVTARWIWSGWIATLWILRNVERCGSRSQGLPQVAEQWGQALGLSRWSPGFFHAQQHGLTNSSREEQINLCLVTGVPLGGWFALPGAQCREPSLDLLFPGHMH